jgi:hypothetical protein
MQVSALQPAEISNKKIQEQPIPLLDPTLCSLSTAHKEK